MLIALYVMAGIFALLMVATIGLSRDRLSTGIRGTVRYGVVGAAMIVPLALVLALFGLCVYAVVQSALFFWTQ